MINYDSEETSNLNITIFHGITMTQGMAWNIRYNKILASRRPTGKSNRISLSVLVKLREITKRAALSRTDADAARTFIVRACSVRL